jgi:MFS family permease
MNSWRETMYLVTFGLALVLVMATLLFILVGLNPKSDDYGHLPWVYSGVSLACGIACWLISGRLADKSVSK